MSSIVAPLKALVSWVCIIGSILFVLYGVVLLVLDIPRLVSAKHYYAIYYTVPESQVYIEDKPHNCEFDAVPYGKKYCHYDKVVSQERVARNTEGHWDMDCDKSPAEDQPACLQYQRWVPGQPLADKVTVYVSWNRIED
jgi:hypothetical protein